MITRLEIDGFKSFVDFELDVPPFLVVMGENAGGKSNLVDALMALAGGVRSQDPLKFGAAGDRGIPAELFHQFEDGTRSKSLRIEAVVAPAPNYAAKAKRAATYSEAPWFTLNLAPPSMRERALVSDRDPLLSDGRNLAAVLGRISGNADAWMILLADPVALLPELRDIRVSRSRDYWELEIRSLGSGWMSAHTASDGTLRVLAILAAAHDPDHPAVLIVDEVENGLHPSRLAELIRRLRRITHDSLAEGPVRQMILTTHSPVVLSALYPELENEVVLLSTAYGPRTVDGRKVGSLRTVVEPVGGAGLPRSLVRHILSAVQPVEPR